MKRLFITFLLLAIVFILCVTENNVVENVSNKTQQYIVSINTYLLKNNKDKALKLATELENEWAIFEDKLSFFVPSDDINQLGLEISTLAPLIKSDSTELGSKLREIEVMLKHINSEDKYRIN